VATVADEESQPAIASVRVSTHSAALIEIAVLPHTANHIRPGRPYLQLSNIDSSRVAANPAFVAEIDGNSREMVCKRERTLTGDNDACRLDHDPCPPIKRYGFLYGGSDGRMGDTFTSVAAGHIDGTPRMNVTRPATGALTSPVFRPR